MKLLILLGLVALVCSSPSFFRTLQDQGSPPPQNNGIIGGNQTNSTNSTNSTGNETDNESQGNTTNNNTQNQGLNISQLIDPTGDWDIVFTNCTAPITGNLCIPHLTISLMNSTNNSIELMYTFPISNDCQNLSGQQIPSTAIYSNGMWVDLNPESPFFGSEGVYRLNNNTILILLNDTNGNGSMCYEEWGGPRSVNTSVVSHDKLWEGEWLPILWQAGVPGTEEESCCLPDGPIIVEEDIINQDIVYMWKARNCTACGDLRSHVSVHNVSIVGGAGYEVDYSTASFVYLINNTLIYNSPQCLIQFELVPPTACNSTNTTTNSTDNESG